MKRSAWVVVLCACAFAMGLVVGGGRNRKPDATIETKSNTPLASVVTVRKSVNTGAGRSERVFNVYYAVRCGTGTEIAPRPDSAGGIWELVFDDGHLVLFAVDSTAP